MEALIAKIAEQIPSLAGLGILVWIFLQHISQEAEKSRGERKEERAERAIERSDLREVVKANTAAHERSHGIMTHMEHVLRRIDGEPVPHTGSHLAMPAQTQPRKGAGS